MNDPIYIFAGGGTGGHLYPGLAVAERLCELRPGAKIVFACSDRAIDRRVLDPTPYAVVPQPVRPLPHNLRGWGGFLRAWFASSRQARQMVADLRPAAVLGLGGFAAGPVTAAAAGRAVPTALLNPDAVPGKANKLLARRVDAIFTQFDQTARHFPAALRPRLQAVGCPLRSFLLKGDRAEAVRQFGLDASRRTLVVNGGSLGAASINDAVAMLADELAAAEGWQVLHVTGPRKAAPAGRANFHVLEYCHRMDLAYAAADLIVGRGGAGTVAEVAATGTPAIILPYPYHKDQQQRLNAVELVGAGGAILCEDAIAPAANAARLREIVLPLMRSPGRLAEMRAAALGVARPIAADIVAGWLANPR